MFVTMFAWAQGPASEAGQEPAVAGLMTLGIAALFVGWILFVAIRELRRMRREERRAQTLDLHSFSLDDLGPTMADGGEPVRPRQFKKHAPSRS